jgi:uncharacterized protein (TIGR03435 family)
MDPGKLYTLTATMPPETTKQQFQLMLQNLLVERFKIRLHHETRVFPGYELVVAPGGPKLRKSTDPDAPDPAPGPMGKFDAGGFLVLPPGHGQGISMGSNGVHAKFQNYTMADFVTVPFLSSFIAESTGETGFHVMDKTGLAGKYDFTLKFDARLDSANVVVAPRLRAGMPPGETSSADSASAPSGLPTLFKAIEQQLGLQLVKVKAVPLDVIIIDHVETVPVEN